MKKSTYAFYAIVFCCIGCLGLMAAIGWVEFKKALFASPLSIISISLFVLGSIPACILSCYWFRNKLARRWLPYFLLGLCNGILALYFSFVWLGIYNLITNFSWNSFIWILYVPVGFVILSLLILLGFISIFTGLLSAFIFRYYLIFINRNSTDPKWIK